MKKQHNHKRLTALLAWAMSIVMMLGMLPVTAMAVTDTAQTSEPTLAELQEVGTSLWEQAIEKGYGSFDTIDMCGGNSHLQGICVDDNMEYMYFSYTSSLAKLDMKTGKVVASVGGFGQGSFGTAGGAHLGCLDYYDGWVYGSIEYKSPGAKFFLAAFDTSKMTETGMDCKEMDEGVNAILLAEPTYDFRAPLNFDGQDSNGFASNESNNGHMFACSGIDGVTVGTMPGDDSGELYMIVAYGVYGGSTWANRYDNDYNVLQFYKVSDFWDAEKKEPVGTQNIRFTYERGLSPEYEEDELLYAADTLYVYTGNTSYGAQNIEYEWDTGDIVLYTYGATEGWNSGTMWVVDGSKKPEMKELQVGQHNTNANETIQTFAKETAECYMNLNAYRFFDKDIELTEDEYPVVKHAVLKCVCGNPDKHSSYGEDECWGTTGVLKNEYPWCSTSFYKSATTGIHWLDNDGENVDYFYIADGSTTAGLYKRTTNANGTYSWSAVAVNTPPAEELLHYSFDNVSGGKAASSTEGTEDYAAIVQNTTNSVGVDGTENGALAFNGFNYPAQPDRVYLDEATIDYLNDNISTSYSYSFWAKLASGVESDGNFDPFIGFYREDGTYAGVFEQRWRSSMKYVVNGIGSAAPGTGTAPGDEGCYLGRSSNAIVPGDEGWHFYTVTEDAGKGVVYMDGVEKASYSVSSTHLTTEPIADFIIGGDKAKLWWDRNVRGGLNGSIDDVTIYSGALTAEEVQAAYAEVATKETSGVSVPAMTIANQAKATGFAPAYPVYDKSADAGKTLTVTADKAVSSITGLTSADVAISGKTLTFTDAFLSSKACGLYELTVNYTDGASAALKLTVTDAANNVAVLDYTLAAADVSGATVKDSSAYGVNAITTTNTFAVNQNGVKKGALVFDGYNTQNPEYVKLSDDDAAWLNSVLQEGYTVNFWAKADGENGNKMSMLGLYADDARPVGVVETYEGEGSDAATTDGNMTVQADVGNAGASENARSAAAITTTGEWTMYSMTYDDAAKTLTLYVNGQQAATTTVTGDVIGEIAQFYMGHTFAKYYKNTSEARIDWTNRGGFKGAMADVQVYPAAMTANEVAALYGEGPTTPAENTKPIVHYTMDGSSLNGDGTVSDASGYGNDGYWQNLTVVPGVDGKEGGALHFDSTATILTRMWMGEDGIDYLNDAVDNQITVSFWFKSDEANSNDTYSGNWTPLLGIYTTKNDWTGGFPGNSLYRYQLVTEYRTGSVVMEMNNYPRTTWPTDIRSSNGKNMNDGQWHYVVMTVDGERSETISNTASQYRRFYIDGVEVKQNRAAYLDSDLLGFMENFEIGGEPYKSWSDTNVRGRVTGSFDDVKIYNVPFEASDVAREYAKLTTTSDGLYLPETSFAVDMADVEDLKVTANNAQNLTSVTGLPAGTYSLSGSTVTLDGDALCELGLGDHSLTLNFLNGSKLINVTVKDSRGYFSPSLMFFEKSTDTEDVSFKTRATFTSTPVSVTADGLTADDYTINGSTITITRDFLMQQQPGAVEFEVTAPSGEKRTAIIHVTNTAPVEGTEPYPVLYYEMDADDLSDGVLTEKSGHGIDAIAENITAVSNKDSESGSAMFFDGYEDADLQQVYLDEDGVTYLSEAIDNSASISFWFASDRITSNYMPVMGMFDEDGRPAMMAQFRTASESGERSGKGQATRPSVVNTPEGVTTHNTNFVAGTALTMNSAWHHVVVVYDGDNATSTVYIDGAQAGTGEATSGVLDSITEFRIGGMMNQYYIYTNKGTQTNGRFYGNLDEVKVYNMALTSDNVAALYEMGVEGGLAEDPTGQKTVESIAVDTTDVKAEYAVGEALDVTGGKVTVTFTDGTSKVIDLTADMVSGFDSALGGEKTLTVTYGGQTAEFTVAVTKVLADIQVTTLPQLQYAIGEALSVEGGKITLTYDDGTTDEIDLTADMVSGFDSASAGSKLLTVTYGGQTTTLGVVVGKALTSIALTGTVKTEYAIGEALDVTGGKVTLTYDDGSTEEIDLVADMVYGFDSAKAGEQTLTVIYGELSAEYTVTVAKALVSLSISGLSTTCEVGDALDLSNAKVIKHYDDDTTETIALTEDMISGFDSSKAGTNTITVTCGDVTTTVELTITKAASGGGGGGSSSKTYDVEIEDVAGGSVAANKTEAKAGEHVTITVTPDEGRTVEDVVITDAQGNNVPYDVDGDEYTFVMPNSPITVSVEYAGESTGTGTSAGGCDGGADCASADFDDVTLQSWFHDAVDYAVENGITNGVTANTFAPNATCTRAQTVTFLWRAAGSPAPKTTVNPFTDVAEGTFYYDAVLWAVENGITNGVTATEFKPYDTVTRGQTVTFLWRSAGAELVDEANPFVDVAENTYCTNAVLWAVDEGVTTGVTATTFVPNQGCTRAQIVTFLYRHLVG